MREKPRAFDTSDASLILAGQTIETTAPGNCYAKLGSKVVLILAGQTIETTLLPSFA